MNKGHWVFLIPIILSNSFRVVKIENGKLTLTISFSVLIFNIDFQAFIFSTPNLKLFIQIIL